MVYEENLDFLGQTTQYKNFRGKPILMKPSLINLRPHKLIRYDHVRETSNGQRQ